MNMHNGTTSSDANETDPKFETEHKFEALKTNLKKLVHRFDTTPEGYLGKATQQIKAHPIAAVGIAFGIGYLTFRLARRR